ncbi:MAG: ATP-binding protein [Myxococcaceae bacterium]
MALILSDYLSGVDATGSGCLAAAAMADARSLRVPMLLTDFIHERRAQIIEEWMRFAATLRPWAEGMSPEGLKDHAEELLDAVVADMKMPQSQSEQSEKSKGQSAEGALGRVGQKHASERLKSGFNLDQLVSEYRALRASVLRLWETANGEKQGEVTRFNEAIDETLVESTARYAETMKNTRDQFLGILGHDLRNPLSSIVLGATQLMKSEGLDDKQARVATRILNSAQRMSRMVGDLLDLTRSRLGTGIPVTPRPIDLAPVCQQVVSELEGTRPDCRLRFEAKGDLHGEWDGDRLAQVVSNLVSNALQYGGEGMVSVLARGDSDEVVLAVHNEGSLIPPDMLIHIFDPMVRHPSTSPGVANATGLGLGLYIAREVVTAHGGTIGVTSTEEAGTTFTVQLPRHPGAEPSA